MSERERAMPPLGLEAPMRFNTPVLTPFCERDELKLSPSEALYGFAGWLTARGARTVMSSSDDASPIADLVAEFCRENDLELPRDRWTILLKHPAEKPAAVARDAQPLVAADEADESTSTGEGHPLEGPG